MRGVRHDPGKLLAHDGGSLEADLPAGEEAVVRGVRGHASAVVDHALWHQQSVNDVDHSVGGALVLADERNAVDEELSCERGKTTCLIVLLWP